MSWMIFLESICNSREYNLTPCEVDVLLCLDESRCLSKSDLLKAYIDRYSHEIEPEAFTQRLKNIYKRFNINERGRRLPLLYRKLKNKYTVYVNQEAVFSKIGLSYVHSRFPRNSFEQQIDIILQGDDAKQKKVDILQTFAPNLNDFFDQLILCLNNEVQVRVLLAWPYSEAAKLREEVLKKYSLGERNDDLSIRDRVLENLETLERVIRLVGDSDLLEVKLYDTLPSLAIYRAGNYILAGVFLHGALAINTFQLELNLSAPDRAISETILSDFELLWNVARYFYPHPNLNWRNDLKVLFS